MNYLHEHKMNFNSTQIFAPSKNSQNVLLTHFQAKATIPWS